MISYELVKDFKKLYLKAILIKYRRCEGLRHVDIVERNKKAKGPLKKRDQRPLLFATRPSQDVLQYGMKKNSTVVQSARNDLQNWSHSQVMSSKLLLSVCRAPQDHKSTVWAIMQHLNYWDNDGLFVLTCWHFTACMFMGNWHVSGQRIVPLTAAAEWCGQSPYLSSCHAISPPVLETHLLLETDLLITIFFFLPWFAFVLQSGTLSHSSMSTTQAPQSVCFPNQMAYY